METNALTIGVVLLGVLLVVFLLNVSWREQAPKDEPDTASFHLAGSTRLELAQRQERWARLTLRERTVAVLAAEGKSNDEIARALGISRRTVEKHLENAYAKLHIRSRGALPLVLPENAFTPDFDSPDEPDTT